jgi:hypothetical protein
VTATTGAQADHRELLLQAYAAYNSQDVEALVALISDDVDWPDDDIGRLHGKDEVRAYCSWPMVALALLVRTSTEMRTQRGTRLTRCFARPSIDVVSRTSRRRPS